MARLSPMRAERLTLAIPLAELAIVSGLPMARLSRAERGEVILTEAQEQARHDALQRLRASRGVT